MRSKEYCGRKVLYATPPAEFTEKSIGKILNDVMAMHEENSREINCLYWIYRGDQNILGRTKEIRSEINNKIVENRAFEVVEFKKGYEFSHPIQYTNAGQSDSAPLDVLNTYARLDGKEAKDLALAEWRYIAGTAYRIALQQPDWKIASPDEAPYYTVALDPRTAFVVYSTAIGHPALFAGSYAAEKTDAGGEQYRVGVYTDTQYFEWVTPILSRGYDQEPAKTGPNGIGTIPIVEYPLNESRLGYVELCRHLFDAINMLDSNRLDAVEQFVQALLIFVNTELETDPETGEKIVPRTGDALEVKGQQGFPADVKYLTAQLDQQETQVEKEDLLDSIYSICLMPNRQERSAGGGDTGQAVVLRNGWGMAEASAKSAEKMFKQAEMQYLRVVLAICRSTTASAGEVDGLTLRDIDVRFTRNRSDNMQVKAQTLQVLLSTGVNPEDAYEYCEMFSDPVAVWLKSKAFQEQVQPAKAETNTDINEGAASEAEQNSAPNQEE